MTAKQLNGTTAPDGSLYITLTDGNGNLTTVGGGSPTGSAGGDLSGTYPNPSVAKVGGVTPGTGVATALGVNPGTAGSFVVNGAALGTPSSGVATNLTGTASGLTAGSVTAGWHTLKQVNVEQTVVTGTTSKTTSFSVTVPGGTLGLNGRLRVTAIWRYTGTAGSKTPGLDFGGTTFWTAGSQASASLMTTPAPLTIANRNSASSQISVNNATATGVGNNSADVVTGSINTAVDQTLALTVTLGNGGDTGAIESVLVEYNNDNP